MLAGSGGKAQFGVVLIRYIYSRSLGNCSENCLESINRRRHSRGKAFFSSL